jgi:hypothetical protein
MEGYQADDKDNRESHQRAQDHGEQFVNQKANEFVRPFSLRRDMAHQLT